MAEEEKRSSVRLVRGFISTVLVLSLVYYLYLKRDQLISGFMRLTLTTFLPIFATVIMQWVFRTSRDSVFLKSLGYQIRWGELFLINNVQMAVNHLPMRVGTVLTAGILKTKHQVSLKHFLGLLASQQLLILVPVTFVSGIVLLLHPETEEQVKALSIGTLIAISSGIAAGLAIPVKKIPLLPQKIAEKVGQVQEATRTLISNKQLMVMLLALSFGMFVTSTLRMYLIYNLVLDESIGVGTAVVLATMVHVSVLVGFTPGGFGIREGLVGLGSRLLSLPAAVGVIATVIERAVVIVGIAIVFIGGKSVKLISGKG